MSPEPGLETRSAVGAEVWSVQGPPQMPYPPSGSHTPPTKPSQYSADLSQHQPPSCLLPPFLFLRPRWGSARTGPPSHPSSNARGPASPSQCRAGAGSMVSQTMTATHPKQIQCQAPRARRPRGMVAAVRGAEVTTSQQAQGWGEALAQQAGGLLTQSLSFAAHHSRVSSSTFFLIHRLPDG